MKVKELRHKLYELLMYINEYYSDEEEDILYRYCI